MTTRQQNPLARIRLLYTNKDRVVDESEIDHTELSSECSIDGQAVVLELCLLNRSRILRAPGIRITKSEFDTVDAANADMSNSSWRSIRAKDSRLTGTQINFGHLSEVVFQRCQMNHLQLQECTLKNVRFEGCDLRGAYFNSSRMNGTVFEGSNLTGADFTQADLTGCDFRRAIIEGIRIAPEQLHGVIVTPDQAMYLARIMGLDIRE